MLKRADAARHHRLLEPAAARWSSRCARTGATVNEYGVEVGLPRSGVHRLVDVFAGAHARAARPRSC